MTGPGLEPLETEDFVFELLDAILLGADDLKQLPHQGGIFCFRNLGQSQWHGYILPTAMPFFPIFLRSYDTIPQVASPTADWLSTGRHKLGRGDRFRPTACYSAAMTARGVARLTGNRGGIAGYRYGDAGGHRSTSNLSRRYRSDVVKAGNKAPLGQSRVYQRPGHMRALDRWPAKARGLWRSTGYGEGLDRGCDVPD